MWTDPRDYEFEPADRERDPFWWRAFVSTSIAIAVVLVVAAIASI